MSKLVIFDLDDTLRHDGFDDNDKYMDGFLCKETIDILKYLKKNNHVVALASHNIDAVGIVTRFKIHQYFDILLGECDDASTKMPLVNKILEETGLEKKDIIFFDDLREITDDLKRNGIVAKQIDWCHGVTMKDILECGL